jgi:hypothetical protein
MNRHAIRLTRFTWRQALGQMGPIGDDVTCADCLAQEGLYTLGENHGT